MALTAEGVRLTQLHQLLQVRLSTQAVAAARLLWSTLTPDDQRSTAAWLDQQIALSQIFDEKAARAAAAYTQKFREAEGSPGGPIEAVKGFAADWAQSALDLAGPGRISELVKAGVPAELAKTQAFGSFAGVAQRVALEGGRRVVDQSTLANPNSLGWRRVSDGKPCAFCALMVSRGPAFKSAKSAGAGRHWHNRCGCSVEEVFKGWKPTADEKRYQDAYTAATKDLKKADEPRSLKNVLAKMRERDGFTDSVKPKVAKPVERQSGLISRARPVKLDVPVKTQLSGSFAPKPLEKRQLSGSFAPKAPPPVVKTQLSGSFAPKKPDKTQLGGSFAPKPAAVAPKPASTAKPADPKALSLADFKVAPKPPVPKSLDAIKVTAAKTPAKPQTKTAPKPNLPNPAGAPPRKKVDDRPRRSFRSSDEGRKWASSVWPTKKEYSTEQVRAVRAYTDESFASVNRTLRTSAGKRGGSRGLDSALRTAPRVPEPVTVTRGTDSGAFGLPKGDLTSLQGKSFTEHGYMSTSVDAGGQFTSAKASDVIMRVNVPAGHKAIYVSHSKDTLSVQGPGENELILARGTKFTVTKATKIKGKWVLECDVE